MKKSYIESLEEAIRIRTDRMNSLIKVVADIRNNYKAMSVNQLNEAIRDVVGMQKEIAEHRDFLAKAKKEIAAFYAPAA
jgi:hypothetical protein